MDKPPNFAELKQLANNIRVDTITLTHKGKAAHLASALSCVDIMVVLYWRIMRINPKLPKDENRDRFILSKGHAVASLYSVLAERGYYSKLHLKKFGSNDTVLTEHPSYNSMPGIEAATGSLGHGLSLGAGMALASKIGKRENRVFVVLGDGECNEGSVWEAALFAPMKKLDNLVVIVDYNKWQGTGRSQEILSIEPLVDKWKAFGWDTYEIDGHNVEELYDVLKKVPNGSGKPIAIVANTLKGKGVSFMEDDNNWHYRVPTEEEIVLSKTELIK